MMKKYRILTIAVFAVGLLSACEIETEEAEQVVRTVNVETKQVEADVFESFLRQVGMVTTNRDVQVSAEVNGRILEVSKRQGDTVSKGETVIQVDDRRLQQEFKRLRAATEQSRENYERLQRLYKEEDIGSEMDFLNAQYTYEQNQASLESIRIDLENASISAPFSGIVESVFTEEGEMVSSGTPVFRLVSADEKKIRLGIPARYSGAVDMGDMAEVWFDFDTNTRYQLPISFIGNTIDPRNRTFQVEIKLPPDLSRVKIDMIANVRLRTERIEDVIVIGEEFIFQKNGNNVVYVVDQNEQGQSIAAEKIVSLGSTFGNEVVIQSGLNTGEELITLGASYLQDGSRIEKIEEQQSEMAAKNDSEFE